MAVPRAYRTELARTIRGTLARFLAIAGIVALGCGFYAGLLMAGPSMRTMADRSSSRSLSRFEMVPPAK